MWEQKENVRVKGGAAWAGLTVIRQVLEICKGDYKAALRMVVVANAFYKAEIRLLKEEASAGYARGKVRNPRKTS